MNKISLGAAIVPAALLILLVAGVAVLKSATASPPAQTSETVDINELMKKIDIRALPDENWPAI